MCVFVTTTVFSSQWQWYESGLSALSVYVAGKLQQHRHGGHLGRIRGPEHLRGDPGHVPDGVCDIHRARAMGQPPGELPECRTQQVQLFPCPSAESGTGLSVLKCRSPFAKVMGVVALGVATEGLCSVVGEGQSLWAEHRHAIPRQGQQGAKACPATKLLPGSPLLLVPWLQEVTTPWVPPP